MLLLKEMQLVNRAVPSGFWLGGGEIKNLGSPQKNFPETKKIFHKILATGEGGEVPKFFSNTKFT
jgi:hypothetical protein